MKRIGEKTSDIASVFYHLVDRWTIAVVEGGKRSDMIMLSAIARIVFCTESNDAFNKILKVFLTSS